ncbi:helix-turn-helix transcriptional regulator [Actinospica durhamensis]|uniref:Helix-turn-helix transcriptional regulator n=1 Tax=Actinospica durhamensis TaxID=1508375 RepID=A0A941EPX3_9ACTN|nr:helix-turn-helix transcriptional regulator [Actinospica durhamensis]MBR7834968.1 helix-turn-helix transcriptional regulator [Actinospica durhamensis]
MTAHGGHAPHEAVSTDSPVYVISMAAELSGLHPQTLRQYDRLGLVSPDRAAGRGRRYSARDIERLREVQRLSQDEGVNLAGIKHIRGLQDEVAGLQARVAELEAALATVAVTTIPVAVPMAPPPEPNPLYRSDLLPAVPAFGSSTALVVWRPQHER